MAVAVEPADLQGRPAGDPVLHSDFLTLGRIMRRHLLIYDLSPREKLLGELLTALTFDRDRESIIVDRNDRLSSLCRMDEADVVRTLRRMQDRRIVNIKPLARLRDGRRVKQLTLLPFAGWWAEEERRVWTGAEPLPRWAGEESTLALAAIDDLTAAGVDVDPGGQVRLVPVPCEEYDDGLAAASREAAVAASGEHSREPRFGIGNAGGPVPAPIGDLPIGPRCAAEQAIGDLPIGAGSPRTHARGDSKQIVQIGDSYESASCAAEVGSAKRFRDDERNWLLSELAELDPAEWGTGATKGAWINRLKSSRNVAAIRECVAQVKDEQRRGKRYNRPLGKVYVLYRESCRRRGVHVA